MPDLIERQPDGKLRFGFHKGQACAWDSTARFIGVLAGSQGGKTSFGPPWTWKEIYGYPPAGFPGRGPGDYLAVSSSYDLFKLKMLPEMLNFFEHTMGLGRYWPGDGVIELRESVNHPFLAKTSRDKMWARIILRSASSPSGLESATAKGAWLDECGQDAFSIDAWQAVLRRLSLAQGRVLMTTTVYNLGWLKTEVYDRWVAGDPDYDIIQFASVMNPSFPRKEFWRAKRSLPDWKFQMFYLGKFARPAGIIYQDFYEEKHVVAPFTPPRHWPRYVGVDFGAVNTAVVYLAQDPESGAYYLYHESLNGDMTSAEHARNAKMNVAGLKVRRWTGGSRSEKQARMDWAAAGVPLMPPAFDDVEAGIDRVIQLFKTDRLFICRNCSGVRAELGAYSRKTDEYGTVREEIQSKADYHRLDALRYAVAGAIGPMPSNGKKLNQSKTTGENPWETK